MSKPTLCVTCRYLSGIGYGHYYCCAPTNVSLVTGAVIPVYAEVARRPGASCGPEAKLWETKQVNYGATPPGSP